MNELIKLDKQYSVALAESKDAQGRLGELLGECFLVQNVYSRTPDDLQIIIPKFALILGKYTGEEIEMAVNEHIKKSPDFPTPHDILEICKSYRPEEKKPWNSF